MLTFDSANTPFSGTAFATLGLTDVGSVASQSGGNLQIAGVTTGYANDYVVSTTSGLFQSVHAELNLASQTGTPIICLRRQSSTANGAPCYFISLSSTAVIYYYYDGTAYHTIGQGAGDGLTGTTTWSALAAGTTKWDVELTVDSQNSAAITVNVTSSGGTVYSSTLSIRYAVPNVAGYSGVGGFGGQVIFSRLAIFTSNVAALPLFDNLLFYRGDSITAGYGAANTPAGSHPQVVSAALGSRWGLVQKGWTGYTAAGMDADFPYESAAFLAGTYGKKVVIIMAGTNDSAGAATAATTEGHLASFVTQAKTAGANKVYIGTIPPRGDNSAANTLNQTINTWIRAGSSGADRVLDYAAATNLTDATNTTYYNADQLHPKDAGQAIMAQIDLAALRTDFPTVPLISRQLSRGR